MDCAHAIEEDSDHPLRIIQPRIVRVHAQAGNRIHKLVRVDILPHLARRDRCTKQRSERWPQMIVTVQRITWAYLRSAVFPGDDAWDAVMRAIAFAAPAIGTLQTK